MKGVDIKPTHGIYLFYLVYFLKEFILVIFSLI